MSTAAHPRFAQASQIGTAVHWLRQTTGWIACANNLSLRRTHVETKPLYQTLRLAAPPPQKVALVYLSIASLLCMHVLDGRVGCKAKLRATCCCMCDRP
jgi:hypothetical protein